MALLHSVLPVLDANNIQHRTHLSIDTTDAPASAVGKVIQDTADAVGAQLVIVGHNRQPVRSQYELYSISSRYCISAHSN